MQELGYTDQQTHMTSLMRTCVNNARAFNRNIVALKRGAKPSNGWTREDEIREHRLLRKCSMQNARSYRRELRTYISHNPGG